MSIKGFFTKEETQSTNRSEKGIHSCVSCGLYKQAKTPKIKPYGNFRKEIMIIGGFPTEEDDEKGLPWQGKTGRFLQAKYKFLDVDIFEDCLSLNAINCFPNKEPNDHQISCCRNKVINAIKKYQPKVVILHGTHAVSSLIAHKWKRDLGEVTKWAGYTIPDRELGTWVCPTFHPSYVMTQKEKGIDEVGAWWDADLKNALSKCDQQFPNYGNEEDSVIISRNIKHVLQELLDQKPETLAIDIETTGLKPYNTDIHKIVSISFSPHENLAFAIPFPTEKKELKLLKTLLTHPDIGKIGANIKFEDNWLKVLHEIDISPWAFDTMLGAHVLDNREGITSLKFQSYVRFGAVGYDEEISSYIKSKNTDGTNRLFDAPLDKVLLYNGIDALLTHRLAKVMQKELKAHG